MNLLDKLWLYFSGKKTVIGSALMSLSVIIQELVIDILEYDAPWEHKLIKALNYFGLLLGGVGIVHKYKKAKE